MLRAFLDKLEARGEPLVWRENIPERLEGQEAWRHFRAQMAYGLLFLALGTVLTLVLRRRQDGGKNGLQAMDWVILALGAGMLIGTAYRSYTIVAAGP